MRLNLSFLIGIGGAIAIIWYGVIHPAHAPKMFLDHHAILLVLGGTAAAALISFPLSALISIFDMLIFTIFFNRRRDLVQTASELLFISVLYRDDFQHFKNVEITHPYLTESFRVISNGHLTADDVRDVLNSRAKSFRKRYQQDAKTLNALAKFPPAFGLLGASTGMIEMMGNLGTGGTENIGAAMAIALVATFWGIALANFVLLPLADHAMKIANEDQVLREMVTEAVVAVKQGRHHDTLLELLRSYLPLHQRSALQPISIAQVHRQMKHSGAA